MVQWLGLWALTAEGPSSIPDLGAKSPQAMWHGQKKKKKKLRRARSQGTITSRVAREGRPFQWRTMKASWYLGEESFRQCGAGV